MILLKDTYERWLVQHSKNIATNIFCKRMKESSLYFLLNKKFVTKTFTGLDLMDKSANAILAEDRRLHKIVLVNIRKKLPLIKLGDDAYEVPFIQFYARSSTMYVYLKYSVQESIILERYLRYIKIRPYLMNNNIPLIIESSIEIRIINNVRTPTTQLKINIRNLAATYTLYSLVFLIPSMLKILTTLHRKALFSNDDSRSISPTNSTSIPDDELRDSNGPTLDDILGELDTPTPPEPIF